MIVQLLIGVLLLVAALLAGAVAFALVRWLRLPPAERPLLLAVLTPFAGWVILQDGEAEAAGVPDGTPGFVVEWLFWGFTLRIATPHEC